MTLPILQSETAADGGSTPYGPPAWMIAFSLFVLAFICLVGYGAWYQIHLTQALTPTEIQQAPAGCIADRVKLHLQKGAEPVTHGTYNSYVNHCDEEARIDRTRAAANESLRLQQKALPAQ